MQDAVTRNVYPMNVRSEIARENSLDAKPAAYGEEGWTTILTPRKTWFDIGIRELWVYRDLIYLFVRRDFIAIYKQTILGPLWFFLQPLLTALTMTIVFGRIAKIPTEGIPDFLFYLSGTVCWGFFSVCLTQTADTFVANAAVFGKVYFPRLAVPVYIAISCLFKFLIQFAVFLLFLVYFYAKGSSATLSVWVLTLPLLIFQMGLLGLGCGILVSSLTTKYQDLRYIVAFGVQLWMYATPVVYPLSVVPERWRMFMAFNPMAAIVEEFRLGFLGVSSLTGTYVAISWGVTLVILLIGLMLFTHVEKNFMDTV